MPSLKLCLHSLLLLLPLLRQLCSAATVELTSTLGAELNQHVKEFEKLAEYIQPKVDEANEKLREFEQLKGSKYSEMMGIHREDCISALKDILGKTQHNGLGAKAKAMLPATNEPVPIQSLNKLEETMDPAHILNKKSQTIKNMENYILDMEAAFTNEKFDMKKANHILKKFEEYLKRLDYTPGEVTLKKELDGREQRVVKLQQEMDHLNAEIQAISAMEEGRQLFSESVAKAKENVDRALKLAGGESEQTINEFAEKELKATQAERKKAKKMAEDGKTLIGQGSILNGYMHSIFKLATPNKKSILKLIEPMIAGTDAEQSGGKLKEAWEECQKIPSFSDSKVAANKLTKLGNKKVGIKISEHARLEKLVVDACILVDRLYEQKVLDAVRKVADAQSNVNLFTAASADGPYESETEAEEEPYYDSDVEDSARVFKDNHHAHGSVMGGSARSFNDDFA